MDSEHNQGFGVYAARTGRGVRLAMQELWLTGEILPVGARLVVRHCFRSGEEKPLEAVYAFALPRDAAMRGFRIVGEGFDTRSELRPADEARKTYEAGIEQGSLSALAQSYKDGLVNLTVGNIRPGETVVVCLEIAAGVACADDGFRFRFPFTLAPGYHDRAAAHEAEPGIGELMLPEDIFGDVILPRWRDNAEGLHRVGFDLAVALPADDAEVASPSHAIAVRMRGEAPARVRLAGDADLPDRDLVLDVRGEVKEARVFTGVDAAGKGRFAALIPSTCFGNPDNAPKQVVFLVDRSGSMGGKPFAQAKQGLLACIAALHPEDRFGVVFFGDNPVAFPGGCDAASQEHRDKAREFIHAMDVAGGTRLAGGIEAAAAMLPEGGDILLITDGQVFETDTIIARAHKTGIRVHCLGIGSASQDRFLALLARNTGGACHFATPRERVDEAALRVFNAVGTLVADDVRCEITGLNGATLAPDPSKTVRHGEPLLVFGACEPPGRGLLRCRWDGGTVEMPLHMPEAQTPAPKAADTAHAMGETLKLIQGARIITDMEASAPEGAETPQAARRLERHREKQWRLLAEEYGLANPAMALVAVVKRPGDQPGELPVTRVIPVGMPQDTQFDAYFLSEAPPASLMCAPRAATADKAFARMDFEGVCEAYDERDLSMQAFMRSGRPTMRKERRSAQDVVSERVSPHDDKMDTLQLVGMLEADGGLPGDDLDLRIARTLAAAIQVAGYLRQQPQQEHAGRNAWIQRMTAFLQQHASHVLTPERATLMKHIINDLNNHTFAPAAGWPEKQPGDFFAMTVEQLWTWIAAAEDEAR